MITLTKNNPTSHDVAASITTRHYTLTALNSPSGLYWVLLASGTVFCNYSLLSIRRRAAQLGFKIGTCASDASTL